MAIALHGRTATARKREQHEQNERERAAEHGLGRTPARSLSMARANFVYFFIIKTQ